MGNILSSMMSSLPNPEWDVLGGGPQGAGAIGAAPTTITETPTTATADATDYSSIISDLRGISDGGYITNDAYRNFVLGIRGSDQEKQLAGFINSLYSPSVEAANETAPEGSPQAMIPGIVGASVNAGFNPFRSPTEWNKDLAANLAYRNTMGNTGDWGHDLVRNSVQVLDEIIPTAFGTAIGGVPGLLIGAAATGLKQAGDTYGKGGSLGDMLKSGLSSAAISGLSSYAGSAVSGALSGAADVGGALDQGWSSTGMPTEGMLSSAPQGNLLSNFAGNLANKVTGTGLKTILSQLFGTDAQNIISNTGTTATTEAAAAEPTSIADAMTSSATGSTATTANSGSAMLKYLSEMAAAMGGGNIGRLKKSAGII
jgi:hypothetical protein